MEDCKYEGGFDGTHCNLSLLEVEASRLCVQGQINYSHSFWYPFYFRYLIMVTLRLYHGIHHHPPSKKKMSV